MSTRDICADFGTIGAPCQRVTQYRAQRRYPGGPFPEGRRV
jgi:hypothetical protein